MTVNVSFVSFLNFLVGNLEANCTIVASQKGQIGKHPKAGESRMPGKQLLIVDDDITSLDIISLLFEKKGFFVCRGSDGAAAVTGCEETKPDLVILDLMMPGMNGIEAATAIRNSGYKQPIVAFTASSDPALHKNALAAGCNSVLTKPCRAKNLVEQIEAIIASSLESEQL